MKNHFFFPYTGNKREEVETIYGQINLDGIDTIVEPFCGSGAISFYISTLHPGQYKYVFNDNNPNLMALYETAKDVKKWKKLMKAVHKIAKTIEKPEYVELVKKDTLESFILRNTFYNFRPGLYPNDKNKDDEANRAKRDELLRRMEKNIEREFPILNFIRNENVTFLCSDANNMVLDPLYNNSSTMIICDPPYLITSNTFYDNVDDCKCNFYETVLENQEDIRARFYCVLEYMWIIKYAFANWKTFVYKKAYRGWKKKNVEHCVLSLKGLD